MIQDPISGRKRERGGKTMHKKTPKRDKGKYLLILYYLLIGGLCGFLISRGTDSFSERDMSVGEHLFLMCFMLFLLYMIVILQTIIHEAGHLVFGLLTGYRFSSFRIGSRMLLKKEGKLKFCKMSIAGTGGQCVMCPPDLIDGKMPFVLYNLGGTFMNILSVLIFAGLYFIYADIPYLSTGIKLMVVVGTGIGLINGIPMRLGMINNDGYNTICIWRSKTAMYAFWLQMKVHEKITEGVRLKDMPGEWFVVPDEDKLDNSITSVIAVLCENRLMDEHKFDEAVPLIDKLCSEEVATVGLHKKLLVCDRLYCELIGDRDEEKIQSLLTKEQKAFMKHMDKFPTVIRTGYAYALLGKKEERLAAIQKEKFEMCASSYPYESDIESDKELLEIVDRVKEMQ